MFYIPIVFPVFQTVITKLQAVKILVAMEGKKMWQLNLQQKSLILQLMFGTQVMRQGVLSSFISWCFSSFKS